MFNLILNLYCSIFSDDIVPFISPAKLWDSFSDFLLTDLLTYLNYDSKVAFQIKYVLLDTISDDKLKKGCFYIDYCFSTSRW